MAEGLLFNTAGKILEVLGSQLFQEIGLAYGVQDEIRELRDTVETIRAVLVDAVEQHSKNNHAVTVWLRRLKEAVYAAEDLLDDFSTEFLRRKAMSGNKVTKEVRIFFSKHNQIAYGLEMGSKIKAIRKRLDSIQIDRQFHLTEHHYDRRVECSRRETHSYVHAEDIIGRENDKNEIIDRLLDSSNIETISVIPIVGIGGLGKTAVAQLVYNYDKVKKHFDLRMWVCVSVVFDVSIIMENIITSATNRQCDKLGLDHLQEKLREVINGKKFLLVLDDVWNDNGDLWLQLETLLMNGRKGSKIIVTTRSERVARITSKLPSHVLEGLPPDMSWSLFERMAFEQGLESKGSKLVEIGKDIVAKCVGVPLAIRTIGRLLYCNRTETYWLGVRDDELSKISQEESDIFPILKLSYDCLPSHLKQCFAYCALFSKGLVLNKEQLIFLWMAEGFLGLSNENQWLEGVGNEYFMSLLSRSFFQDVAYNEWGDITKCKIHDLMHDLAELVAGTECTKVKLDASNVDERTRHIFFESDLDSSWEFPTALTRAKNLRTFVFPVYFHQQRELNDSSFKKILSSFNRLHTLVLSELNIEMVPSSIGKLKHLRYLNLCCSWYIKELPNSMSRLFNLQALDLYNCCSLAKLPKDIRKMVSLRYLDIGRCGSLSYLPRGLGLLTNLCTLPLFVVSRRNRLSLLNGLNSLRGSLQIENLGDKQNTSLANLEAKEYLRSLELKWAWKNTDDTDVEIDEALLEGLKPHQNLRELTIDWFGGIRLSSWLSSLTNLSGIKISNCEKCQYIPQLDQLPYLKSLTLDCLGALEYIDSSSTPSRTIFPSLEKLELDWCHELKGWWKVDDGGDDGSTIRMAELPSFPCLSELTINLCPKLISMPLYPTLEKLDLWHTSSKTLQQTIMSPTTSTAATPLSKLKYLTIVAVDDLEISREELLENFPAIVEVQFS